MPPFSQVLEGHFSKVCPDIDVVTRISETEKVKNNPCTRLTVESFIKAILESACLEPLRSFNILRSKEKKYIS